MPNVFYSPSKKHEVFDVSGTHDLSTIQNILPADKKANDYQMVQLSDTEVQRFDENGNLSKFDIIQDRQAKEQARLNKENAAKAEVAAELKKLGVSNKAISGITGIPEADVPAKVTEGNANKNKP